MVIYKKINIKSKRGSPYLRARRGLREDTTTGTIRVL